MNNLSPKAEPVTWAMIVGAAIAAAVSYGFNITDQLADFLVLVGPIVLAGLWARFKVWAPDSVQDAVDDAAQTGKAPKVL